MSSQMIGHFRITAALGKGGMGVVYRATDTRLGREVALKVLPGEVSADPARLLRFEREARALAALNHPNVAAIHGVEQGAIVMELVEGPTLAERISHGPLSIAEVRAIGRQIADALEAAHEKGIIHRDLKPANIKVTPQGVVKLLDFGLAKAMEPAPLSPAADLDDSATATADLSTRGAVIGTAAYMSPEQTRGDHLDHRTDIWSFGVVLFEMATGRRLFGRTSTADTLAAVLNANCPIELAPAALRPLLARCLERDRRQRLGWIGDARRLLEGNPEAAVGSGRRLFVPVLLVAIGAVAGIGGLAWLRGSNASGGVERTPNAAFVMAPLARPVRLTTDGSSLKPALSPDGRLVAYLSRSGRGRTYELHIRQTPGSASMRLAAFARSDRPAFNADGSRVYYVGDQDASRNDIAGVYEVAALGGEPRLILPGADRVTVSPDGKWLAYTREGRIRVRGTQGGEELVIGPPMDVWTMAWSADSTRVMAMSVGRASMAAPTVIPVDGSPAQQIDPVPTNDRLLRLGLGSNLNTTRIVDWLANGDVIASLRYGDAVNLWRLRLDDPRQAPVPLTAALGNNSDADARDGRIVFTNSQAVEQVFSLPGDVNAGKALAAPEPVTPDNVNSEFMDMHPDGQQMVYVSAKGGIQGVMVRNLKTGQERVLHQSEYLAAHTVWSPDGGQVAFFQRKGGWPAYVIPAVGGTPRKVGESGGRIRGWSRDGRHLLIWRVTEPSETIGVLEVATGKYTTVMTGGQQGPLSGCRLSPDGKWVSFLSGAGIDLRVWIAPFRGDQSVPEAEWISIAPSGSLVFWAPDSKAVFYLHNRVLYRRALDSSGRPAGQPNPFYRLDGFSVLGPILNTATATKDRILFLANEGPSDLWMMDLPQAR